MAYDIINAVNEKLYASPREHPGKYRLRGGVQRDIKQAISPRDWAEQVEISSKLCARIPTLRGAIRQKSEWAFAGDSWQPIYYGELPDAWSDIATDWLTHQVFPNALRGNSRRDLIKAMQVSGMGWDIHGDDLALFSTDPATNMPRISIIPGTRIGNGTNGTTTVSGGVYSVGGYSLTGLATCDFRGKKLRIYNGIIYDDAGEPIAARVLGQKRNEAGEWVDSHADFDLGFQYGAHLASEYEWHEMGRPLPRIAASILQWMNKEQVDQNLLKMVDLSARKMVIHKLAEGQDAATARGDGAQQVDFTDSSGNTQSIYVDTAEAGDVTYIGSGENLEGADFQNPHPNVEGFVKRILSECLQDLGWPYELTDLSSTGRAPTRLSCELVNNSLWQKQCTGETRLFWFVKYAIANGIKYGHIPKPPGGALDEPYKWTFGFPAQMSVDMGNDTTAALNRLRYGLTSQRLESARQGYVQKRIDKDRTKEVFNLISRTKAAKDAVKSAGLDIPDAKILELFWSPAMQSSATVSQSAPGEGDAATAPAPTPTPSASPTNK